MIKKLLYLLIQSSNGPDEELQALKPVSKARAREHFKKAKKKFFKLYKCK